MVGRRARAGGAVAALIAFIVLTVWVRRDLPAAGHYDRSWHDALRRFGVGHPAWLSTMRAVTGLGETVTILTVDLALVAACWWQRRPRPAVFVAVTGLGGWAVRLVTRDLVNRPRPVDPLWPADGSSFPSGHTTNATLMLVAVLMVGWPALSSPAARWVAVAAVVSLAGAVGFSRVAGGVHWPTDVLGGWLLALAYLGLVSTILPTGDAADTTTAAPARRGR